MKTDSEIVNCECNRFLCCYLSDIRCQWQVTICFRNYPVEYLCFASKSTCPWWYMVCAWMCISVSAYAKFQSRKTLLVTYNITSVDVCNMAFDVCFHQTVSYTLTSVHNFSLHQQNQRELWTDKAGIIFYFVKHPPITPSAMCGTQGAEPNLPPYCATTYWQ